MSLCAKKKSLTFLFTIDLQNIQHLFFNIFRQSDPGLEWEMDKEVESLGNIEIIEGDEEEGDDDDVDMDEEEQDTNGKVGTGLGIIEIVCGSDF